MKREIRQRCGFGCVICGLPLYEYEHMSGWANVHEHAAEEITLLCDRHHREKTGGLLPVEVVREANSNPFNLREGVSKPYDLHFSGNECEMILGSNSLTTEDHGDGTLMIPVLIDGYPLLSFVLEDGHLLLDLSIFDEFNNPVLRIADNQLVYSVSPWDIQLVGRNLLIREAARKFLLDITFEVPNKIVIGRGRFLLNGVEVLITKDLFMTTNSPVTFTDCTMKGVALGFALGPAPPPFDRMPALVKMPNVSRYVVDRKASVEWAKQNIDQRRKGS